MRVVLLFMALIAGNSAFLYFPIFGGKSLDLVSNGGSNSPTCMMTKGVNLTGGFCFEAWINPWDPQFNFKQATLFFAQDSKNNTIQFDISTQNGSVLSLNGNTCNPGPPYNVDLSAWCGLPTLTINNVTHLLSETCFFPSLNETLCVPDLFNGTAKTIMNAKYVAFCLNVDSTAQFWTTAEGTFPEVTNDPAGNGNVFTLTGNAITSPFPNFNGSSSTVFIGGKNCNGGSDTKGFYGRIDEVRISDSGSSFTNDVSDSMMRRKARGASNYPHLRHYWDFEDLPSDITDKVTGASATLVNKVPVTSNSRYTYDKTWPAQRYYERDIYVQTSSLPVTIPFGVTSNTLTDYSTTYGVATYLIGNFSTIPITTNVTLQPQDQILFSFHPNNVDNYNVTISIPSICQTYTKEGERTIIFNSTRVRATAQDDSVSWITFNVINPTISINTKNYSIFNETVNGTVVPSLSGFPAAGGNLNLFGSFPNPLTNNITVYMRSSLNPNFTVNVPLFNSSNTPSQNTLKSLVLPVPPGIGNITIIKMAYCHMETPINLNLTYQAANVTGFSVIDDSHLLIRGTWMGPSRIIDGSLSYDRIVVELNKTTKARQAKNPNVFNCVVTGTNGTSANQTHIKCLVVGNVTFTAADLNISTVSVYIGSNKPSRSGVVGFNAPPVDTVMTTGLFSTTESAVQDEKKGGLSTQDTIIVIVVLVGIAIIVAVLIVIVIVFIRRNKRLKGETKKVELIPLHKKDFSPLIFGEGKSFTSDDKDKAGNLAALEDMLLEADMKATFAVSEITQITEADYISRALVIIFESRDQVMRLLHTFIEEEVKVSESAGTLFRSNSMVSKMFKFYSRLIGLPYLYETIGPDITQMLYDDLGLEVDPERMEAEADLDEMRWTLMAQSQKILKAILNSVNKCPMQFRIISYYLQKSVGARFADSVNKTIGGFMFLRFFCPAVTSPESYGIVDEAPSASERRLLILMTKALQNLSNDVEFGSKEPYMIKMNDFILSNRDKLNDFFSKLIHAPTTEGLTPSTVKLPKDVKENALVTVGLHIRNNIEKVKDQEIKARFKALYSDL